MTLALSIYVLLGMLFMVAVVVTRGKRERTKGFESAGADESTAMLFLFVALLWPVWLLGLFFKNDDGSGSDRS